MTKRIKTPAAERLRELFTYSHKDKGLLIKKYRGGSSKPGSRCGTPQNRGYRVVMVDGKLFLEHRLVWKMLREEEPPEYIDHINEDKQDNRIDNLRSISNADNCRRYHDSARAWHKDPEYCAVVQEKRLASRRGEPF